MNSKFKEVWEIRIVVAENCGIQRVSENYGVQRFVANGNLWYTETYGIHRVLLYADNPGVQSRKVYREFWDKKMSNRLIVSFFLFSLIR